MSRSAKVRLADNVARVIKINPAATEGATLGVDLRWPNGRVVTINDLVSALGAAAAGGAAAPSGDLVWRFISERPANVDQVAALAGVGLVARTTGGTWVVRSLSGSAGRIVVGNPSGDAGGPSIDLAEVTLDEDGVAGAFLVDQYGRVVAARDLVAADIPVLQAGRVLRSPAIQNTSRALELADGSRQLLKTDTAAITYTLPEESDEDFPLGATVEVVNAAASGDLTIERDGGVELRWIGGSGADDDRDIEPWGWAQLTKVGADEWIIKGEGVV